MDVSLIKLPKTQAVPLAGSQDPTGLRDKAKEV